MEKLASEVGTVLHRLGLRLATAESCTGGAVAAAVTGIPGSSEWFDRGFVTYSNESKTELLGVRPETLAAHGAVSERTVCEMVEGALAHSRADVAIAITGIAGPGGGTMSKPVGTVWVAWQRKGQPARARLYQLSGDRETVRRRAAQIALWGLVARLDPEHPLLREPPPA